MIEASHVDPAAAPAEPEEERDTGGQRWLEITLTVLPLLGLLGLWWAITAMNLVNSLLLPGPGQVFRSAAELIANLSLVRDSAVSLLRVMEGFLIAVALALPIGAAMGMSRVAHRIIDPIIEFVRPIPPIAVIPLAILWFGIEEASKIFIIVYGAFFPMVVNTMAGFRATEETHLRAIRMLGANRWETFRHVTLPTAFPHMVVGMRLGMGMAFVVLVAAELIAASSGLGYMIQEARTHFQTDAVLVGIVTIGLLGFLLNKALLALERRIVRWR